MKNIISSYLNPAPVCQRVHHLFNDNAQWMYYNIPLIPSLFPFLCSPLAVHAKSIVAILHLLVALSQHCRAPIRLPDHVSIQVVVVQVQFFPDTFCTMKREILKKLTFLSKVIIVCFSPQKREGILQSRQVQEEITGNTEYVFTVILFN